MEYLVKSLESSIVLATLQKTGIDLGTRTPVYDLYDPYVIETLIRYPKKFLGGVELMMKKLEEQDWAARIRGTALSERYRVTEDMERKRDADERARLDAYIEFLHKNVVWQGIPRHFPNLMAIAVHPDGSFAYWKDNSKLQWATAIDIAADPGHTYTMVTTSHNTSSSFDCSSSLPSRDSFVASKQLYHHEDFRPSRALLGAQRVIAPDMRRRALEAGVDVDNLKYQGDITSSTIENHLCPNALSCSVHIVGIAAESTAKDILDAIYEGGIAKLSIKPPNGHYRTSAVALVFKTVTSAKLFLERAHSIEGVRIQNQRIVAMDNRDKARAVASSQLFQTRILRITGPLSFNSDTLESFLHTRIDFKLVDCQEWMEDIGERTIELSFMAIEGQARSAMKCFWVEVGRRGEAHMYRVSYGPDPCDPSSGSLWNGLKYGQSSSWE